MPTPLQIQINQKKGELRTRLYLLGRKVSDTPPAGFDRLNMLYQLEGLILEAEAKVN